LDNPHWLNRKAELWLPGLLAEAATAIIMVKRRRNCEVFLRKRPEFCAQPAGGGNLRADRRGDRPQSLRPGSDREVEARCAGEVRKPGERLRV